MFVCMHVCMYICINACMYVYVTSIGKIGLNAASKVFYFKLPVGCTGPWDAVLIIWKL